MKMMLPASINRGKTQKKNLIVNINKRNILLIREKFVILHPVWNKYQKIRKK